MTPTAEPDASPLADPGPPPAPPSGRPAGWDRFFAWLTDLGVARGDGWVGGVCAGVATRLGIDPLIVRGVVVVAALFGLPMFIVYGIAWALLPDLTGRIHLRELVHRRFDPAMVGIGLMLFVGLFPVIPWFFATVLPFGFLVPGFDWSPWSVFTTLIAVAVIGGAIFLIARAASHRTIGVAPVPDPGSAPSDPLHPSAPHDSGVGAPVDPAEYGSDAMSPTAVGSTLTPPPLPPARGSADAEFDAWRAQHDAWKVQDDAWRRQQQDAERAARDEARRERTAASAAFAADAAERRRVRRASRPRTSVGFVFLSIGAALVIGALASLWFGSVEPGQIALAVAFGLFAAALVVAISMIVAGAVRRRSGFLAFVTVVLLFAGAATAFAPVTRGVTFADAYVNNLQPTSFTQLSGSLTIDIANPGGRPDAIVIEKRSGDTFISVADGVILTLDVVSPQGLDWNAFSQATGEVSDSGSLAGMATDDGRRHVQREFDNRVPDATGSVTHQTVRLDQSAGTVFVTVYKP
jgi:phage shock protein PspC (stress-responsive transcriptional regulator)